MTFPRSLVLLATVAAGITTAWLHAAQPMQTAPETFTAPLHAWTQGGAAVSTVRIQIDQYTIDTDRKSITDALAYGGYPNFLQALKKAPVVGFVEIAK
jgi:hypothetical protein